MPSDSKFFIDLQEFINNQDIFTVYYEEASKKAKFPYGVISDPNDTDLRYGILCYFDIMIWSNDEPIGLELEEKIEKLINILDGHIFSNSKAVVYFESKRPISDPEYELIKKKITFSVRIF